MSRTAFVLAVTLLVVAASAVFTMTFDRANEGTLNAENAGSRGGPNGKSLSLRSNDEAKRVVSSSGRSSTLSLSKSAISHLDKSQLRQVERILARTRSDARQKLAKYQERYKLTKEQRRDIFPFIVAYHNQAHPKMIVNGQPLPSITPGSTLDETIAGFLDSAQQDALAKDVADHNAWWEDVVGQLETDLDTAISNGEVAPVAEAPANNLPAATGPAVGDGESSGHSGGNLFDLLGQ